MTKKKLRLAGSIAFLVGIAIGCAPSEDEGVPFGSIVFPAEAYLGGTVALAISSNYLPGFDIERYGLHRDNVELQVFYGEGADNYVLAEPRTVFDLSPSRSSRAAIDAPGAFATIVVFDLPTELETHFAEYPQSGVEIRVNQIGFGLLTGGWVTVLGPQDQDPETGHGLPSFLGVGLDSDPSVPGNDGLRLLEEGLQPQTMIRLRAVHDDGIPRAKRPGFGAVAGQEIGSIEFYVRYLSGCMANLRAYPNSEAVGASVILGPQFPYWSGDWVGQKLSLVDPNGFTLDKPVAVITSGHPAGEGPFLDLAFDWAGPGSCPLALEEIPAYVGYSALRVTDLEGQVLIEKSSFVDEFFTEHLVDLLPGE